MKLDTINKTHEKSTNTIDLSARKIKGKTFKLTRFKIFLKRKNEILFYFSIIFIMLIIVFFWAINLKDSLKNIKMSDKDKAIYEDTISAYDNLKRNMSDSINKLKESLDKYTYTKDINQENKLNEQQLLDALTPYQQQIINSINSAKTTPEDVSVPYEFNQEELKVRLDLLNQDK